MEPALIYFHITPRTPADREKLVRGLQVLSAADDSLHVGRDAKRGCTIIGATSHAQLEDIVDRLKREFEVEARVGRPMVAYRETVTRSAEGAAKHVTISGGRGEYAHVALRLHPRKAASGYRFEDTTIGEAIPKRFMTAIDGGIRESMANGVLNGYPIVDVRVEVHDGSYHETDSTDAAFRIAAAMAFQEAARKAEPVVLEPVMRIVVRMNARHVDAVLADLVNRRGEFQDRTHESDQEIITAHVPLSALSGFEAQLRSLTSGSASCSMRFAYHQPVVRGPAGDDDDASHVGAPRRSPPDLRSSAASVPEPDDRDREA